MRLDQDREDDPGRRQERRCADDGGAPEPPPQIRRDQERPDDQGDDGEVAGLVVKGDRHHDEEDRRNEISTPERRQGPVGEPPGEGQGPRRTELGPHAVTRPHVRLGFVADARYRGEERSHRGRGGRRPAAETEQPARPEHRHGPERQEQVERPAEDGVGRDHRSDQPGRHRREALVVQVLRRAQAEVGEPACQRQVPGRNACRGEAGHLLVDGRVVEIRHGADFGAQFPQTPGRGHGDDDPRPQAPRGHGPAPWVGAQRVQRLGRGRGRGRRHGAAVRSPRFCIAP